MDLRRGARLSAGAEVRKLEDRAARLLALLCRRRGEVVSKADILEEVWRGRTVSANSVAVVVGDLRRAMGDDAAQPEHILTVAKRGYRLAPERIAEPMVEPTPPAAGRGRRISAGAILCAAALVAAFALHRADGQAPLLLVLPQTLNDTGRAADRPLAVSLNELVAGRLARTPASHLVRSSAGTPATAAGRRVEVRSRLILWAGTPTLALTAVEGASGRVLWTDMAEGDADHIAAPTLASVAELQGRLAALRRGER